MKITLDECTSKFIKVRDILKDSENEAAYRLCYKMPYKFYGEHDVLEAVKIIIENAQN